ncbi:MAG: hypothetical protein B6244_00070 [Candidatus Cloacimonetes bacterium 4572_55]|nr:MAG: hypothetical protein B6244_00070 [Candidatus Cloacimonetes bacterium 4572_55]
MRKTIILLLSLLWFSGQLYADSGDPQLQSRHEFCSMKGHFSANLLDQITDDIPGQENFDVLEYGIELNLTDYINHRIVGSLTMRAAATLDGISSAQLHFANNMTVHGVGAAGTGYTHINQGPLNSYIDITLDRAYQSGEIFEVSVSYSGQPEETGLQSFAFDYHNGVPLITTLSEPYGARSWWPCKDIPSDKADQVDLIVTVPDNLVVSSNGVLLSDTDNGDGSRTFHWRESYPICTYLVSIAVTNYAVQRDYYINADNDSLPIYYYVYPEVQAIAFDHFSTTPDILGALVTYFGEYPFMDEKYGNTMFPWGGAMEHQTNTSYGAHLIYSDYYRYVNTHEITHQWFGDLISPESWNHIWLNEGFASYGEALWTEYLYPNSDAYKDYMLGMQHVQDTDDGSIYVPDEMLNDIGRIFSGRLSYDKGAWALHMLRHVMGDDDFFEALQTYRFDPALMYGTATTEDFQAHAEEADGVDLDWFFDEWIYGEYHPKYNWGWTHRENPDGGYTLNVLIEQVQSWQLFKMPIDLIASFGGGDEMTIVAWDSLASQQFTYIVDSEPTGVQFDPREWILRTANQIAVGIDDNGVATYHNMLAQNFPNPFNPETVIYFQLTEPQNVRMEIYDINGRRVKTLMDQSISRGSHSVRWNGVNDQGDSVNSGIYFYRLTGESFQDTKRMTFIK